HAEQLAIGLVEAKAARRCGVAAAVDPVHARMPAIEWTSGWVWARPLTISVPVMNSAATAASAFFMKVEVFDILVLPVELIRRPIRRQRTHCRRRAKSRNWRKSAIFGLARLRSIKSSCVRLGKIPNYRQRRFPMVSGAASP